MMSTAFNQNTASVHDVFGRPLKSLRLSVTDRCNLRCQYCMPEEEYTWLPRETILTFEEMDRLVNMFTQIGVDKVRLTGGEPLLRKDLQNLIQMLRKNQAIQDIALTTNGVLLEDQAQALFDAGLHRITVSLDTLKPERFKTLTRRDTFDRVLSGIHAVNKVGFQGLKIDTVAMRGFNDDELVDLIEFGKTVNGEVRFIEYMDVGGANDWSMDKVLSRASILLLLTQHYGRIESLQENSTAPAQRFVLPDGTTFQGPRGLREMLMGQSDEFVRTTTEKMLTYALGRGVEYYDQPAIRKIMRDADPDDYRWSSIILGIVRSTPFQMRRASS